MNIFQTTYNWFKNLKLSLWARQLLQEFNDILIFILIQVSIDYIDYLKGKIIYASSMDVSNREKFEYVFNEAKKGFAEFKITLTDSTLNCLIEFLISKLKKNKII